MADTDEVAITNYDCIASLTWLQRPIDMGSLPNVLQFLAFIRRHPGISICFVGPARCGKTTMIRNVHFTLTTKEISSALGEDKWLSVLTGGTSVTVVLEDPANTVCLKYMPPKEPKDQYYMDLAKTFHSSVMFHFRFKTVHSLKELNGAILDETMNVAHFIQANYPNSISNEELRTLTSQMEERVSSSICILLQSLGQIIDKRNTYIFVDDYDVPFCDGEMDSAELNAIKQTIKYFVDSSTKYGYVVLFGSLSFPAKLLKMEEEYVYTMKNSPLCFLGIPQERAKAYLEHIGKQDVDLKKSAGMSSAVSHDIHPLCFYKSVREQSSLIEIGVELQSYYFILQTLVKSPDTYKFVPMLYSEGWYPSEHIEEMYSDYDIINAYMKNRIPISGCVKVLLSLGFIKKCNKTDNDDCLKELGKSRRSLPATYYSFSNVILYYSFTYFMQKISAGVSDILTHLPFSTVNCEAIVKLCQVFLQRHGGWSLEKNKFVDKIFYDMIRVFPNYLVVLRFIVDDGVTYNLDLGLFSFAESSPSYVWEFKIAEDFMMAPKKDHEAIHQIYCRKYYNFMRRFDSTMTDKIFKDRLNQMFFITYVTNTKDFASIAIRKYNENLQCDCNIPSRPCKEMEQYPLLKHEYYKIPTKEAVDYSRRG